nr:GDSL-type esterase/lipase family protein [Sphingomonas sp. Y57]
MAIPTGATAILAAALAAMSVSVSAQEGAKPTEGMSMHDFAAKWMMQQGDLADIGFYRDANARLAANGDGRARIVLMGDSITFHWQDAELPTLDRTVIVNRGIAGQNSSQMLLRFEDDVVALRPRTVVILAGTNDVRVYAGDPKDAAPAILARLRRNVTAMTDIAAAYHMNVVLSAIPPIARNRQGSVRDPATIRAANDWLREFAKGRGLGFVDYGPVLADAGGALIDGLSADGLHPNAEAYRLMRPLLAKALIEAGAPRREPACAERQPPARP